MAFKVFHKLVQLNVLILLLSPFLHTPDDVSEPTDHQPFPEGATCLNTLLLLATSIYQNKNSSLPPPPPPPTLPELAIKHLLLWAFRVNM